MELPSMTTAMDLSELDVTSRTFQVSIVLSTLILKQTVPLLPLLPL